MVLRLAAPEPHGRRGGLRHASVLGKRSVWGYSPGVHSNRARRSTHARIAAPSLRGSAPSLRGPARKGPGRGQASRGQWRPPAALEGPRDHRTEPTRDAHHGRAQQLETGPVCGSTPPLAQRGEAGAGETAGPGSRAGRVWGAAGPWRRGCGESRVWRWGVEKGGGAGERG